MQLLSYSFILGLKNDWHTQSSSSHLGSYHGAQTYIRVQRDLVLVNLTPVSPGSPTYPTHGRERDFQFVP